MEIIELILNNNSRMLVIELSVRVEELISKTLGCIIDIDLDKSKSLGFSSDSLSFNNKATLLSDKKSIPKEMKDKMKTFMYIRNKFAHVNSINSFENLILYKTNSELNNLNKWYPKINSFSTDTELKYRNKFCNLYSDIFIFLFQLTIQYSIQNTNEKQNIRLNEEFIMILKNKNQDAPITTEEWNKSVEEVIKKMEDDKLII
jgi:hypothetical protein